MVDGSKWTPFLVGVVLLGSVWLELANSHPVQLLASTTTNSPTLKPSSTSFVSSADDEEENLEKPTNELIEKLNSNNSIDKAIKQHQNSRNNNNNKNVNKKSERIDSKFSISNLNSRSSRDESKIKSFDPVLYLSKYGYLDTSKISQPKRGSLVMLSSGK